MSGALLICAVLSAVSIGAPLDRIQDRDSPDADSGIEQTSQLIVMITGQLGSAPSFGAGILFGRDRERLYILTANHVVRRGSLQASAIRVSLKSAPARPLPATLLDHFDPALDVAVLAIEGWSKQDLDGCKLPFDRLGQPPALERGAAVYALGNPNGDAWRDPVQDRLLVNTPREIRFQSAFLAIGFSGGGLLDGQGLLAGMIVRDEPPNGSAVPIDTLLALAASWGYPVRLRTALENSAAPLHLAAAAGDLANLKAELSAACGDPNLPDRYQATPLHYAAQAGQLEAVRLLLQSGADVNAAASTFFERVPYIGPRYTALHMAAWRGDLELMKLLLAAGARVNAKNKLGQTPLCFVATQTNPPDAALRNLEMVRVLIAAGADVNATGRTHDNALHRALTSDNRDITAALIEAHADVNHPGWGDRAPLALAVDTGDEQLVRMVIAAGADVNAGNALPRALFKKKESIVAMLLRSRARLDTAAGIDVLQEAIREDWREVMRLLIERGADVNAQRETQEVSPNGGVSGGTPRIRPLDVAAEGKDTEIVKLLLAAKANPNLPDDESRRALHHAACKGAADVLSLLLNSGSRLNAEDFYGQTALDRALSCDNAEAARFLRQHGATRGSRQVGAKP